MEKMDAAELQERINKTIGAIVPPEHVLIVKDELLWGNLSPFKREMGEEVTFYQGMAHYFTRRGLGARMLVQDTKGGYAYQSDGEPFTQSRDSFYMACLFDPRAEELIDYMKTNMSPPTRNDHFNILQTHVIAESIHLNRPNQDFVFGIEQDRTMFATRELIQAHHERLLTKAILDFNITFESAMESKGKRADIEIDKKYMALFERNRLNNTLAEKPLTKAQRLSDEIESEDFTYKTPTTKSHRNKL